MPHYSAGMHTTGDVVRQAIIPITRSGRCSYAEVTGREPLRPAKMVTHSWRSLFRDLVAAVIADAVRETSFELISQLLENEVSVLETLLEQQGTGDRVYWICAFSVNQHLSICENLSCDKDSVTDYLHAGCDCGLPKILNTTPPLSTEGQSIGCEMNKFDDMMALLAEEVPEFSQVVAVDAQFRLLQCILDCSRVVPFQLRLRIALWFFGCIQSGGFRRLSLSNFSLMIVHVGTIPSRRRVLCNVLQRQGVRLTLISM